MAAAKKAVPRKGTAKKPTKVAPARAKAPSKYQSAIANPQMSSATRKVAIKPYSAAWKAEVKRKNKAYDKSWRKKAGGFVEALTPLGAADDVYRAVKGRDAKTGKKYNRKTALASAALVVAPIGLGKAGKKAVKTIKTVKSVRDSATKGTVSQKEPARIAKDAAIQSYVSYLIKQEQKKLKSKSKNKGR